jgi:glycosyltransferase involved in cell wall biosynthesis
LKILFLTRYERLGASSRLRTLQYLPLFRKRGWTCDVKPLFPNSYVEAIFSGKSRLRPLLRGYLRRFFDLLRAPRYDLVWIEKETLPYLPAVFERLMDALGIKYVVDYDDALFHSYDQNRLWLIRKLMGRKIDVVMGHATAVMVGNSYLGERAKAAGARRIEFVPTVVDRDEVARDERPPGPVVIGWIGTPYTAAYLKIIEKPLAAMQQRYGVRVRLIGSGPISLDGVQPEYVPWSEEDEWSVINTFDIGVMPLIDRPFERGKSGYKLIQYFACGKPVVASPVGVNSEIVSPGENGFLATSEQDWTEALARLVEDTDLRSRFGAAGRARFEAKYSLRPQAEKLGQFIERLIDSKA